MDSIIHTEMVDTLSLVTFKITRDVVDFQLWDKCRVVVGMTSEKYGKDLILFGGDK